MRCQHMLSAFAAHKEATGLHDGCSLQLPAVSAALMVTQGEPYPQLRSPVVPQRSSQAKGESQKQQQQQQPSLQLNGETAAAENLPALPE